MNLGPRNPKSQHVGGSAKQLNPRFLLPGVPLASQEAGPKRTGHKAAACIQGSPLPSWQRPGSGGSRNGTSPTKTKRERPTGSPASAPGSTQRPLRARCRLQLGHDPRFSRRTIGRGAGAGGCVAGRAGSLSGELRSTSRGSPFRAQAPFASPIPPSIFSWKMEQDSRLLFDQPTPHHQIRRLYFLWKGKDNFL